MTYAKAAGITIGGVLAWMTIHLGEAWWILLVLLAIDALFHWQDEAAFWGKAGSQLLAVAASAYVRGATGIDATHLVVAGLVGWEIVRVSDQLVRLVKTAKLPSAERHLLEAAIRDLTAKVDELSAAASKNGTGGAA